MGPKLTGQLKQLVVQYMVVPIDEIMAVAQCGFLAETYAKVIDAMCLEMTVGFNKIGKGYVGAAVIALFPALIGFYIFRHVKDNHDLWNKHGGDEADNSATGDVEAVGEAPAPDSLPKDSDVEAVEAPPKPLDVGEPVAPPACYRT